MHSSKYETDSVKCKDLVSLGSYCVNTRETFTDMSRKCNDMFTRFLIGMLYLRLNLDVTVSSISHIPNPI